MSSPPWCDVVMLSGSRFNRKEREAMELRPCSSGLGQGFSGEKNADSIASLKSEIRNSKQYQNFYPVKFFMILILHWGKCSKFKTP